MCTMSLKIRSVNSSGLKYAFVPCGKCAECRKSYQSQWFFRLAAECLAAINRGWQVAFFTLTYNDEHLPELYGKPCFRRQDVRRLILRLRKKYHKEEGVTGLRYLIASEYGDNTKRPHYHGIICFPSEISAVDLCSDIQHFWSTDECEGMTSLGFIYPTPEYVARDENLFLCNSAYGAASYAAKYCCKDVTHETLFSEFDLDKREKREFMSFHIQSRSLGFEILKSMSDEQKFELYTKGLQLVGSDKPLKIPLYIKNKLFFDPSYTYDEKGNRLVERIASPWFRKYKNEIFNAKVDFYENYFASMDSRDYWSSALLGVDCIDSYINNHLFVLHSLRDYFDGYRNLAVYYVAYYGVPYWRRSNDILWSWFQRFESCFVRDTASFVMNDVDQSIHYTLGFWNYDIKENNYEEMKKLDRLFDFWNNKN